jgi:hypothetical protein
MVRGNEMEIKKIILTTLGGGILFVGGAWWYKTQTVQAAPSKKTPAISMIQAVETVLNANPGTTAMDVNLESENNKLAWEVQLNNDLEVYVDANNQQIIKTEQPGNLAKVPFVKD